MLDVLETIIQVILFIDALLLLILILVQNKGGSVGILGGGSQTAFGSRSADVLTRTTQVLTAIFILGSFGLAYLHSENVSSKKSSQPLEYHNKHKTEKVEKKDKDANGKTSETKDVNKSKDANSTTGTKDIADEKAENKTDDAKKVDNPVKTDDTTAKTDNTNNDINKKADDTGNDTKTEDANKANTGNK